MICYEVHVNGRRLCVAGAPGYGVLGFGGTWVKRDPARRAKGDRRDSYDREEHTLQVGGLFGDTHLDWIDPRRLRAGDVIRVRVVRRATADTPIVRFTRPPRGGLRALKAHLSKLQRDIPQLRREIRALEREERERKTAGAKSESGVDPALQRRGLRRGRRIARPRPPR